MSKLYIGVDLGGTNIVAGVVTQEGKILCKKSVISARICVQKTVTNLAKISHP